jgi:hypothetical protein
MTRSLKLAALLILLGLASCISGQPPVDSYTSPSTGKTTVIESDSEQCTRSCNDDYSRCMDTEPAETNPMPGEPPGMFGASADCRSDLKSCLQSCKSR